MIYSLIETCKRARVEPFEYLRDVLERIGESASEDLLELTPQGWRDARAENLAAAVRGGRRRPAEELRTHGHWSSEPTESAHPSAERIRLNHSPKLAEALSRFDEPSVGSAPSTAAISSAIKNYPR